MYVATAFYQAQEENICGAGAETVNTPRDELIDGHKLQKWTP